jgi:hypothetical protein
MMRNTGADSWPMTVAFIVIVVTLEIIRQWETGE